MKREYKKIDSFIYESESDYPDLNFHFFVRRFDETILFDANCEYDGETINLLSEEVDEDLTDQISETLTAFDMQACNDAPLLDERKEENKWSLEVRLLDGTEILADCEHSIPKKAIEGLNELREYLSDYALWCKEGRP